MTQRLRRELRILRIVSIGSGLGFVFLTVAALQQPTLPRSQGEITAERINIVEKDGWVRMVLANSDRQTQGGINGRTFGDRKRPAGIVFFNDEGDENGGLVFAGRDGAASASLTFDQYKQDQAISLSYDETAGQRTGGLIVRDRVDLPLDQLVDKFAAAQQLPTDVERRAAMAAIGANDNGARRVFVGKDTDRSAIISLSDAHGKPRLRLRVDAAGAASIEFLDDAGKVVRTVS